jgi:hypothetical protein
MVAPAIIPAAPLYAELAATQLLTPEPETA